MLTDYHKLIVEFDEDWKAYIFPIRGQEIYFNVDFEEGMAVFFVAYRSGYYESRNYIEYWLKVHCDQFMFNGNNYGSLKELSLAMWSYEVGMAANEEDMLCDIIQCAGIFTDEVKEMIKNGRK